MKGYVNDIVCKKGYPFSIIDDLGGRRCISCTKSCRDENMLCWGAIFEQPSVELVELELKPVSSGASPNYSQSSSSYLELEDDDS